MTIYEVKQKAIDALGEVDVAKLSLFDLGSYVQTLSTLHNIKDDTNIWKDMMDKISTGGFNGPKQPTISELASSNVGK